MNPVPLYTLSRGGVPEVQVFGEIWISDGNRTLFQSSEVQSRYPARSLLKPFQFLATGILESSLLSEWHVAALGSISATNEQVTQIKAWTSSGEMSKLVARLAELGIEFSHSCFSKHLAILQACGTHGWSVADYCSVEHPFNKELVRILAQLLKEPEGSFRFVVDGCKLPTPILWMDQLARLFQTLANISDQTVPSKLRELMLLNPEWIGGPERIDSRLMKDNGQRLIAKEGADGLLGIGVLPSSEFKNGLGIVVKLVGGYQPVAAALAIKPFFERLGLQCNVSTPEGQSIQYHFNPWVTSRNKWIDISPQLNSKTAVWPGDETFQRVISFSTDSGDHLSLSSIKTSLHIGAHTDSPLHFGKGKKGIDKVDLWKYQGDCQVIEVKSSPNTEIKMDDVKGVKIIAPRVLFKTLSFPETSIFNNDFNALSVELVEYLATLGVVLVGIDTPSIDLFESKELLSHKATLRAEMAILEGIDLNGVAAGIYELTAIPLKIEDGDASPVRALLKTKVSPSVF